MLERAALVVVLVLAACLMAVLVRALARQRMAAVSGTWLPRALRERVAGQGAGIVYFYGPQCGPCRQQALILDRIAEGQEIAVVRVDATREAALAEALAVLTVPTTVIVDSAGAVRAINAGLRSAEELMTQCRELAGVPNASA